ncbi:MAG: alpha/beta hydrolase, partial [Anaerolineae bacterium]|nr:alpha/beta hydrolase [Anaerolineae bacterium]
MNWHKVALVITVFCLLAIIPISTAQEDIRTLDVSIEMDESWTASGKLNLPAEGDAPFPTVILYHGSGLWDMDATYPAPDGTILSSNFAFIAEELAAQGIAVLSYNKRGVIAFGEYDQSQVQAAQMLPQLVSDAETVLAFAQEQPEVGEIYLYGWSEGAWVASHVANRHAEDITGVILQAPPNQMIDGILQYQHLEVGLPYLAEAIDTDASGTLTIEE